MRLLGRLSSRWRVFGTAAALLGTGVGVGASLFSIVDAVLFQRLTALRPNEVVFIYAHFKSGLASWVAPNEYDRLRRRAEPVAEFSAHWSVTFASDTVSTIRGEAVDDNYFDILGVQARLGRTLSYSTGPEAGLPVVVSEKLWNTLWGRDERVLGAPLKLDGKIFTVVGVMPPGFRGISASWSPSDCWIRMPDWRTDYKDVAVSPFARLRAGRSIQQLQGMLGAADESGTPGPTRQPSRYEALAARQVSLPFDPAARLVPEKVGLWLLVLATVVLSVVAANVGGLLRSAAFLRGPEFAVKMALGASWHRLARELAAEALVISLCATVIGAAVAGLLLKLFAVATPSRFAFEASVDWRLFVVSALQALVVAALATLTPIVWIRQTNFSERLCGQHRTGKGLATSRRGVVGAVVQLTCSAALLAIAVTGVRGMKATEQIQAGYDWATPVVASVQIRVLSDIDTPAGLDVHARRSRAVYARILDTVGPAFSGAAVADRLPVTAPMSATAVFSQGSSRDAAASGTPAVVTNVSPGYFNVLRIPLVRGRSFDESDNTRSPRVAIVSDALASRLWPGADPLGRMVSVGRSQKAADLYKVVGVVGNALPLLRGQESGSTMYLALGQMWMPSPTYVMVRPTSSSAGATAALLRDRIRSLDSQVEVPRAGAMAEHAVEILYPRRVAAALLIVCGLLSAAIAAGGVYAMCAFAVGRQQRDIGIRMAVGATRASVVTMILASWARVLAISVGLGVIVADVVLELISSRLVVMPPLTMMTVAIVAAFLFLLVMLACLQPALRAGKTDVAMLTRA